MPNHANIVICGAGIAGVSAAFFLSRAGVEDILLIDERPPLSLTSDHSTECYRNWWPDPAMLALMNRSIDLMEQIADETGNAFRMNRRGYLYVTADEGKIPSLRARAERISGLGAGPLRIHARADSAYQPAPMEGFRDQPVGADLLLGPELIRGHFPYLTEKALAALHVRRAGWLSAQQLGMTLLEGARRRGVRFESARLTGVETAGGRVLAVRLADGRRVAAGIFVNAAGPFLGEVGRMLHVDLPVHTELHLKAAFKDHLGVVGREAPLLIWDDPQYLPWDEEERAFLAEEEPSLLAEFPSGVHTRPEGSGGSEMVLMLWEYRTKGMPPVWPPPLDEQYPEIALRGLATMLPGLRAYFGRAPRPILDGGYYTKTPENRPLIGPLPVEGAYVLGALSGYGIMSACAAGELLAAHITGRAIPAYANEFALARYDDPEYQQRLEAWDASGQL
ncbi:MAG: FAD-binding oxidoreductase [Chloroflexi bacterium]|nr:FAD-binding oxidoreductase [Chloroflexota bacterium]